MIELNNMSTEKINPKTGDLDIMTIQEALLVMNEEDATVPQAIKKVIPQIEEAVKLVIKAFKNGGRLIYVGAGTSGRLGVLDAAECPPTFGTDPSKVVGLIAGGEKAFLQAVEGAEDSKTLAEEELKQIKLAPIDIVIGIAASGRTPYVIGALNYAREVGCKTIGIACNSNSMVGASADIAIEAIVGPEVLTGSTRLKAGTAQKLILNMISTISMVGIGKVYKNLMVDVQMSNDKLVSRAVKIVTEITKADEKTAYAYLKKYNSVKYAIFGIMARIDDKDQIEKILSKHNGNIRESLKVIQ